MCVHGRNLNKTLTSCGVNCFFWQMVSCVWAIYNVKTSNIELRWRTLLMCQDNRKMRDRANYLKFFVFFRFLFLNDKKSATKIIRVFEIIFLMLITKISQVWHLLSSLTYPNCLQDHIPKFHRFRYFLGLEISYDVILN